MAETSSTGSEEECWARAGREAESAARSRAEIFQFIGLKTRNCLPRLSLHSKLIQRHRPVAGVNGQQFSAAIHFAVYVVTAEAAFDRDGNVGRDTAVAGVQSHVRRQISGEFDRHAAIRAANLPRLPQLRSGPRFHFNPAIAGAQFENIEPPRHAHRTVAGVGAKTAIDILDFKPAVAGCEIQLAFETFRQDRAVAAADIDSRVARHVDLKFNPTRVDTNRKMGVVRLLQLNVDRVALLMFHNFQPAASDVPPVGGYARLNLVLIPGLDVNIGVVRFDAQLRLTGKVVSLRPIVRESNSREGCEGEYGNEQGQTNLAHGGSSSGPENTSIQVIRRKYGALVREVPEKTSGYGVTGDSPR